MNVGDLLTFLSFLKLCAGRTAQEITLSFLGGDAGVSHNTAKSWLSILEASYIIIVIVCMPSKSNLRPRQLLIFLGDLNEQLAERIQTAGLPLHLDNVVIYGGETSQQRSTAQLLGWRDVGKILHQALCNNRAGTFDGFVKSPHAAPAPHPSSLQRTTNTLHSLRALPANILRSRLY